MQIAILGNIGAGKTTCVELLANAIGGRAVFEPVEKNPYLDDFYREPARFAFPLQVYMLSHRLRNAVEAASNPVGFTFLDRTVYEDRAIFATHLHATGHITEEDWRTYLHVFETMEPHFQRPDMYVYLRASLPTLQRQIAKRARDFEAAIPADYLQALNVLYEAFVEDLRARGALVYTVEMDITDLTSPQLSSDVVASVREVLGALLVTRQARQHPMIPQAFNGHAAQAILARAGYTT